MHPENEKTQNIIFFDGVCLLCHASVRFIIKNDPKAHFSFASLQTDFAKNILMKRGIDPVQLDTLFLLENDQIFSQSTAVLKIASHLQFPWSLLRFFGVLPVALRDHLYRWIAKNRYQWWGRLPTCTIPDPVEKNRFLT